MVRIVRVVSLLVAGRGVSAVHLQSAQSPPETGSKFQVQPVHNKGKGKGKGMSAPPAKAKASGSGKPGPGDWRQAYAAAQKLREEEAKVAEKKAKAATQIQTVVRRVQARMKNQVPELGEWKPPATDFLLPEGWKLVSEKQIREDFCFYFNDGWYQQPEQLGDINSAQALTSGMLEKHEVQNLLQQTQLKNLFSADNKEVYFKRYCNAETSSEAGAFLEANVASSEGGASLEASDSSRLRSSKTLPFPVIAYGRADNREPLFAQIKQSKDYLSVTKDVKKFARSSHEKQRAAAQDFLNGFPVSDAAATVNRAARDFALPHDLSMPNLDLGDARSKEATVADSSPSTDGTVGPRYCLDSKGNVDGPSADWNNQKGAIWKVCRGPSQLAWLLYLSRRQTFQPSLLFIRPSDVDNLADVDPAYKYRITMMEYSVAIFNKVVAGQQISVILKE